MRRCHAFACLAVMAVLAGWTLTASGATITVGQPGSGRDYTRVWQAVAAASSGDTIEIDPGTYWHGNTGVNPTSPGTLSPVECFAYIDKNLTLRGVGDSRPIMDGYDASLAGKGIWVIQNGAVVTIQNIEFTNARNPVDYNGSGILVDSSTGVTVYNCYMHDCDDGFRGGASGGGQTILDSCELYHNGLASGSGSGYCHNIYTGNSSFTLRYSWSHDAVVGHQVKTRAQKNYILYNLISDDNGSGSYEVDIPQGGTSYLIGNSIYQGGGGNSTMVTFCEESSINSDLHLYIVNNTFFTYFGEYINNDSIVTALVQNNIFMGSAVVVSGPATLANNWGPVYNPSLVSPAYPALDFHLTAGSTGALNLGGVPSPSTGVDGTSLIATQQYVHPCSYQARPVAGTIDIGAFEYVALPPVVSVDTGPAYVYEGWPVSLHASATDPSGYTLTYVWTQTAGQGVTLGGASTATVTFTAPTLTSRLTSLLTLQVTASNAYGGAGSASRNVQVYLMGDIDQDNAVNLADLKLLVAAWNGTPGSGNWNPAADLDNNSNVNLGDLKLLVANWNRTI